MGGSLIGLSAINVALGAKDLRTQAKEKGWGNVNKLDAAQVTVGAFGTAASGLEWFGLGSASVTRIAASANLFGIVLSIPSSWYSIYDGAYKLSTMPPASTGDPEADQYLQLQYDKGIRTDDDYFQY